MTAEVNITIKLRVDKQIEVSSVDTEIILTFCSDSFSQYISQQIRVFSLNFLRISARLGGTMGHDDIIIQIGQCYHRDSLQL